MRISDWLAGFRPARSLRPTPAATLRLERLDDRDVPAVFTVTTAADDGAGSLRQAILAANAAPGADAISFNIPGTGVHTIQVQSQLPRITGPVAIDGYTQPGSRPNTAGPGAASNAVQTIQIDGSQALGLGIRGLVLTGGSSTVRGLVVQSFRSNSVELWGNSNVAEGNTVFGNIVVMSGTGNRLGGTTPAARNDAALGVLSDYNRVVGNIGPVEVSGSHNTIGGTTPAERNVISGGRPGLFLSGSDNVIQGNFIGTDVTGMAQAGNRRAGIYLAYTAQRNLIGGTAPGARNVISGNSTGIFIDSASDNLIQGNYIGLNAAGTDIIFNSTGIMITSFQQDATNNLIGGTAAGAGNVISGNGTGVGLFSGAVHTRVQGNLIGTLPDGRTPAGNYGEGVSIASTAHDNLVGGTTPGAGNVIAYSRAVPNSSSGAGVLVMRIDPSVPVFGNAILGNSIFGNARLGIDLTNAQGAWGVTPNDNRDPDAGANNLQNFPVLQSATTGGGVVAVRGTLNSTPRKTFRIEFFANAAADPTGYGEGERFLGFTTVTTDAAGNASFTARLPASVPAGQFVTTTATDPGSNTSEFSKAVRATAAASMSRTAPQSTRAAEPSPAASGIARGLIAPAGNGGDGQGSAIANGRGVLTVTPSVPGGRGEEFSNHAVSGVDFNDGSGPGGGLDSLGTATLKESTVTRNKAESGAPLGGVPGQGAHDARNQGASIEDDLMGLFIFGNEPDDCFGR